MQNPLRKNEECIIMVMLVIASALFDQGLLNRIRFRSLSYRFPHTVNIANDFFRFEMSSVLHVAAKVQNSSNQRSLFFLEFIYALNHLMSEILHFVW